MKTSDTGGGSETENKYPSIRDAITNNSHLINFYCGFKYTVWMVFYAVLTVLGVIVAVIGGLAYVLLTALEMLFMGLVRLVDMFYMNVIAPIEDAAFETGGSVEKQVKKTHQRSKKTPIARRIWGECPVSFRTHPKWFSKLVDKAESL